MIRTVFALAAVWMGLASAAQACQCLARYPVCDEVANTDLVFIGTVESVEPAFLDPWNPDRAAQLHYEEITRLLEEGSAQSLEQVKGIYRRIFPNMPEYYQELLKTAATESQLRSIFGSLSSEGRAARIRVKTVFQHKRDDDDDKKKTGAKDADDDDDDDLTGKILTVWTEASDCGIPFQAGETYLVYGDNDEETGQISTSVCTRTARLSDAGADLAYLYYFKNEEDKSTRVEGFVTSDPQAKFRTDAEHYASSIDSPVAGAIVQLKSDDPPRYTTSDPGGRFVFDGLAEGTYTLILFAPGYPRTVRQLGFPQSFHASNKSCVRQILTAPKNR
ncbi:MAG TPA: carboxypeptidase regulatory-like domain-containing protein [Bryobacteraceae bacterium]|nr:carboxypeptidase regulatory-like domain-containing protein [Bryobacteraceae bacterium]